MNGAFVHGQLVLIEGAGKKELVVVVNMLCEECGKRTLVIAAHHTRALIRVLQDALEHLPPELAGDDGSEVAMRRPQRPENN